MNAATAMQGEEETTIMAGSVDEVVEVVAVVVEAVLATNRPFEVDHQAVDQESQTSGVPR